MQADSIDWFNGALAAIVVVFLSVVIGVLALERVAIDDIIRGVGPPPPCTV